MITINLVLILKILSLINLGIMMIASLSLMFEVKKIAKIGHIISFVMYLIPFVYIIMR